MITVSNVITIENPSEELLKWCRQNLKLKNPEFVKKQRMHFWVGNTPEYLYLYETHGDKLVLPSGVFRNIFPMIDMNDTKAVFPVAEKVDYGCNIPLYDYQEKAVEEVYWKQYGILQSAAGSGKTQMGIALIAKWGRREKGIVADPHERFANTEQATSRTVYGPVATRYDHRR